jgi:hypothetical protein
MRARLVRLVSFGVALAYAISINGIKWVPLT